MERRRLTAVTPSPTARGETAAVIQNLRDGNLFTIALDDQGEWFRYHHLFRDLLRVDVQNTLAPSTIAALHRRASDFLTPGLRSIFFSRLGGGARSPTALVEIGGWMPGIG